MRPTVQSELRGALLDRAELDHESTNLGYADLRGASLSEANVSHASLSVADLRGANLSGAHLVEAKLDGANLRDANSYEPTFERPILGAQIWSEPSLRGQSRWCHLRADGI